MAVTAWVTMPRTGALIETAMSFSSSSSLYVLSIVLHLQPRIWQYILQVSSSFVGNFRNPGGVYLNSPTSPRLRLKIWVFALHMESEMCVTLPCPRWSNSLKLGFIRKKNATLCYFWKPLRDVINTHWKIGECTSLCADYLPHCSISYLDEYAIVCYHDPVTKLCLPQP